MQAQQALIYPGKSFLLAIAVVATLVAAVFGVALVVGLHPAIVSHSESAFAQHQQAPDAAERNAQLIAAQAGGPLSDLTRPLPTAAVPLSTNQSPDAQDRNAKLNRGN